MKKMLTNVQSDHQSAKMEQLVQTQLVDFHVNALMDGQVLTVLSIMMIVPEQLVLMELRVMTKLEVFIVNVQLVKQVNNIFLFVIAFKVPAKIHLLKST